MSLNFNQSVEARWTIKGRGFVVRAGDKGVVVLQNGPQVLVDWEGIDPKANHVVPRVAVTPVGETVEPKPGDTTPNGYRWDGSDLSGGDKVEAIERIEHRNGFVVMPGQAGTVADCYNGLVTVIWDHDEARRDHTTKRASVKAV